MANETAAESPALSPMEWVMQSTEIPKAHICLGVILFIVLLVIGALGQTPKEGVSSLAKAHVDALQAEAEELEEQKSPDAPEKAARKYEEILGLYRLHADRRGEAWVLFKLGNIHSKSQRYESAKKYLEESLIISKEINSSLGARVSLSLGQVARSLNQNEESLFYLNQSLGLFKLLKDSVGVGFTLVELARLREIQGKWDEATKLYEEALVLYQSTNDKDGVAFMLQKLGEANKSLKRYTKSIQYLERLLVITRKEKYRETEAVVLGYIGNVYLELMDYKKALTFFENSLAISREIKNQIREAEAMVSIGLTYGRSERSDRATDYFTTALSINREIKNRAGECYALFNLGSAYANQNLHDKALHSFREGLTVADEINRKDLAGIFLNNLGWVYQSLKQYENARVHFERALNHNVDIVNKIGEGHALQGLGDINQNLNQEEIALPYFERALQIARELKNQQVESNLLVKLGQTYYALKQYEKIHGNYAAALSIARQSGYLYGQTNALIGLGAFYVAVGQPEKAERHYAEALWISKKDKNKSSEALALIGMGEVYNALKQSSNAQEYFQKALIPARDEKDEFLLASAYIGIGLSYRHSGDFPRAIKNFELALTLAKESGAIYQEGQASNELGNVYLQIGQYQQARQFSERALVLGRAIRDPEREAYSLLNLMHVSDKAGGPPLGAFYGKQFINMLQAARAKLREFDHELQKSLAKSNEASYRDLAEILIRLGRIAEAERVLAMLKEDEYFDYVRRDRKVADGLIANISLTADEQKALDEYKKHSDRLTALAQEYGQLQTESTIYEAGKFPKQNRLEELEKLVATANQLFTTFVDDLKAQLEKNDLRVATLESGSQSILKELNQPQTVMISTIAGDDRLNLIVTTSDAQRAHTVNIKAADLNKLVHEFRSDVRNARVDPRIAGKKIYDILFPASLQKDLEGVSADTIVWSLDGTLRYVPVAALWDGKQYLVEKYKNVLITLASRNAIGRVPAERNAWKALGVGVSKEITLKDVDGTPRNFEALISVPSELCGVIADPDQDCSAAGGTGGILAGKSLLDDSFTLPIFKNNLGRYPVVHIASHFSLNEGNENDSYLLLGGGEERKLTLAAVRQGGAKFVGVELLTLSACNTAMSSGNRTNGVEVEGFGVLAQNQGAKAVLASLWSVSDSSTRDLMIEFYKQLEGTPRINKAEALQKAQLSLLRGNYKLEEIPPSHRNVDSALKKFKTDGQAPFAHPYYWSPFILMGNWQ